MKRLLMIGILTFLLACSEGPKTPIETSQIVVESFYQRNNDQLKEYTTPGLYNSYMAIQEQMTKGKNGNSNFQVVKDTVYGDTAWVKFNSAYADRPETFKLIKQDGKWKVTEIGLRERIQL